MEFAHKNSSSCEYYHHCDFCRLEHNLAVSNHVFHLKPQVIFRLTSKTIMWTNKDNLEDRDKDKYNLKVKDKHIGHLEDRDKDKDKYKLKDRENDRE